MNRDRSDAFHLKKEPQGETNARIILDQKDVKALQRIGYLFPRIIGSKTEREARASPNTMQTGKARAEEAR